MSVIGNFISNLNQQRINQTHNSVEGLIRATLGNRFLESPIPPVVEQEPINEKNSNQETPKPIGKSEEINESINKKPQKKEAPKKSKDNIKKSEKKEKELSPFQKSLLITEDEYRPNDGILNYGDFKSDKSDSDSESLFESMNFSGDVKPEPIIRKNEYVFHRDSDETFECVVTVEGGSSDNTVARLVLKTDMWNILFDGSIKNNGTCEVPLKKLSLFPDGTIGKAYLEIVVDDVVFVPWESPFRVSTSKKVTIQSPTLNRR